VIYDGSITKNFENLRQFVKIKNFVKKLKRLKFKGFVKKKNILFKKSKMFFYSA
jgi:hypothetical protein